MGCATDTCVISDCCQVKPSSSSPGNSDDVTGSTIDDTGGGGGGSDDDQQQTTSTGGASQDSNMTGLIVGVVVGVFAVAVLAVIVVVVVRRNKRQRTAAATRLSKVGINLQMNPMEKKQVPEDSPIPCAVPGWEMHMDKTSGQAYYHNPMSGETSWVKPLVEGSDDWVTATMTQLSEVGSNLQMNPLEKKQVPEDSPISCDVPGWEMHMDKTSGKHTTTTPCLAKHHGKSRSSRGAHDWVAHVDPRTKQILSKLPNSNKRSHTTKSVTLELLVHTTYMNVCVHTHVRAADFFPRTLHPSLQKIINISTCSYHLLTQLTQNKHFKKTLQKITITKTIYMGYPYPYVNKYIIIIN